MIGPYILAFVFAVIFIGCIREACNEKESRWLRITGHVIGALVLVLLLAISRNL